MEYHTASWLSTLLTAVTHVGCARKSLAGGTVGKHSLQWVTCLLGSAWPSIMGPLLINQTGFSPSLFIPQNEEWRFIHHWAWVTSFLSYYLSHYWKEAGEVSGCETTVTQSTYLFSQHREKGLPRMRVKNSWFALKGVFTLKYRKQV